MLCEWLTRWVKAVANMQHFIINQVPRQDVQEVRWHVACPHGTRSIAPLRPAPFAVAAAGLHVFTQIAEPPESIERVFKDIFDWLGARCGSTNATTGASTGAGAGAGAGTGVTGAAVVSPTPQGETVSMPGRANTASDVLVDVRTA